jgi:hypothetical protein
MTSLDQHAALEASRDIGSSLGHEGQARPTLLLLRPTTCDPPGPRDARCVTGARYGQQSPAVQALMSKKPSKTSSSAKVAMTFAHTGSRRTASSFLASGTSAATRASTGAGSAPGLRSASCKISASLSRSLRVVGSAEERRTTSSASTSKTPSGIVPDGPPHHGHGPELHPTKLFPVDFPTRKLLGNGRWQLSHMAASVGIHHFPRAPYVHHPVGYGGRLRSQTVTSRN